MGDKLNKKLMGKKARAAGARFELKVRKDLESKGWIVSKWMNNVELKIYNKTTFEKWGHAEYGKLIPSKHKFRGPGIPMAIGTGFPDFIAFKNDGYIGKEPHEDMIGFHYSVIGVEVKSNGYLDKAEKEKCKWLLDNNIFSKILIASKGKKRGEIKYVEFRE